MISVYFTYGSAPHYPFGREDYVRIQAIDVKDAIATYRQIFPDLNKGLIHCADYYVGKDFDDVKEKYYPDTEPALDIQSLAVKIHEELRALASRELDIAFEDFLFYGYKDFKQYLNKELQRIAKNPLYVSLNKDDLEYLMKRYDLNGTLPEDIIPSSPEEPAESEKYILIECADRELNVSAFDTLEEAQSQMKEFYEEAGCASDAEGIYEYEAYKNDANNHANFDWKIVALSEIA